MSLFGLLSDLKTEGTYSWMDSLVPVPSDERKLIGYRLYGILGCNKNGEEKFTYDVQSTDGVSWKADLFGACRNALGKIGNCSMELVDTYEGMIIMGIALDDDWVVMTEDTRSRFQKKTQEELKVQVKQRRASIMPHPESVDMGLVCDLNRDVWKKMGDPPRNKSSLDYHKWTIAHQRRISRMTAPPMFVEHSQPSSHSIMLQSEDGRSTVKATLREAYRNPFTSIGNAHVKLMKDGDDDVIIGIMIPGEWVAYETLACNGDVNGDSAGEDHGDDYGEVCNNNSCDGLEILVEDVEVEE